MKELVEEEEKLLACKGNMPSDEMLTSAKKDGFSDKYLSQLLEIPEEDIRNNTYFNRCRRSMGRGSCKRNARQCILLFNI